MLLLKTGYQISKRFIYKFDFNVSLICGLAFLNIFYKFHLTKDGIQSEVNLWNPTWMLFGPLIYFANKALKEQPWRRRNKYLHLIPLCLFSLFYCITLITTDMADPWSSNLFIWYQNSFFVIPISLSGYSLYTFSDQNKSNKLIGSANELIVILCGLYLFIAAVNALMYLCWGIIHVDMGIDYRFFSHLLLFLSAVFIFHYFYRMNCHKEVDPAGETDKNAYANSSLYDVQADHYVNRIHEYFRQSDAFLRPDLSLELVSVDMNVPKHHLSQLFNVYIGKSFYRYVAEQRISYAISQLEDENVRITIEALAYECGFNSKSSFNRHFKSITGYTPLEYLLIKKVESKSLIPLSNS